MTQARKLPIKRYSYSLVVCPAARVTAIVVTFGAAAMVGGYLIKGSSWTSDMHLCIVLALGVTVATVTFFSQLSTADWRRRKELIDPTSRKCFLLWSIMMIISSQYHWHGMQTCVTLFAFMTIAGLLATLYKFLMLACRKTDDS